MVIAEKNVRAGLLVQVVDQVHLGGVDNISFGTTTR